MSIVNFPNFLGIGVPKAGTTWLHYLLDSHPDIWMPKKRKELYYFSREYHRGNAWYAKFFPKDEKKFKAIGEVSPYYLYHPEAAVRIKEFGAINKFIVLLRDPVERAWSYYKFRVRLDNYSGTFREFLNENPQEVKYGFYTNFLGKYFKIFERKHILILCFEEAVKDILLTKKKISDFLEIPLDKFPKDAGSRVHNKGFLPRFGVLYSIAINFAKLLRDNDLYLIESFFKKLGIKNLLTTGKRDKIDLTDDDIELKLDLYKKYEQEFHRIKKEKLIDISIWQKAKIELLMSRVQKDIY